jgi:hypothetical protein
MREESKNYKMPPVEIGEWVLYRPHQDAEPIPAMVTKVSSRTLTVWSLSPGYGGVDRFSVHHLSDPGLLEFPEWKTTGTWEHRRSQHAILAEKLAALERKVAELEGRSRK